MLADIYTGTFKLNSPFLVNPSCPTGNCAWNSSSVHDVTLYASLGVCGKCQDSTTSLKKTCAVWDQPFSENSPNGQTNITAPYCNYTLPNRLSIAGNDMSLPLLVASPELANTTQFQHLATPFSILSIIRGGWTNRDVNGNLIAQPDYGSLTTSYLQNASSSECALYPCVRYYSANVINDTFSENILDT